MALDSNAGGQRRSPRAVVSLILAILSLIASPVLAFGQYIALIIVAMATNDEPAGSPATVVVVAVFAGIAALALGLPILALVLALRARRGISRSAGTQSGEAMATVAAVLAAIALAVILVADAYNALSLAGVCSLDGCG